MGVSLNYFSMDVYFLRCLCFYPLVSRGGVLAITASFAHRTFKHRHLPRIPADGMVTMQTFPPFAVGSGQAVICITYK